MTLTPYLYFKDNVFPPLPFDIRLSLDSVFRFWERKVASGTPTERVHAQAILDSVAHAPELRQPFSDLEIMTTHQAEVSTLLSALFPDMLSTNEIKAASLPFFPVFFNMTDRLKDILHKAGPDFQLTLRGFDHADIYQMACAFLIGAVYDTPVNFKRPIYFDIPDVTKGTMRHYRAMINGDFSKLTRKPGTPELTPEDIQLLIDNSQDLALWQEKIPPGSYLFEGLSLINLYDQTEDEALSELRNLLLKGNALQDDATLQQLQYQLAQYLSVDEVELGFEAYDEKACMIRALYGTARPSKILGQAAERSVEECFCDSTAEKLLRERDMFSVSNVRDISRIPSPFVQMMYEAGVGSFIVAPLRYGGNTIGFIELTSSKPGVLSSMVANKLRGVLPMFTVAVGRSIDSHQTRLESIIQDKFTSIHPTVSWRFMQAAEKVFQHRTNGHPEEVEAIQFQDVYPLYGQFDIRGSSDARNGSIQADLKTQLDMAAAVLREASEYFRFPVYDQLLHRISELQDHLDTAIHAGDEVKILDFISRELDPVFTYLAGQPEMAESVNQYRKALDPALRVIYQQRKDYEASVTLINERIGEYVSRQQEQAQQMFPHYFEKYKTDGVEYNAYVGQSLVQGASFHPLHLKNLRLWQLLLTAGVEHLHQSYKHELPMPLDITSLILVHSNPLAIRFRMDEKRFDVDGAYNIRYEILKKRIDKAFIKGTRERLTQPGMLSIVYSQDWEAEEYLPYIRYMQSLDLVEPRLDMLELEDLQGTAGLRAIRVGLRYSASPEDLIRQVMEEVAQ